MLETNKLNNNNNKLLAFGEELLDKTNNNIDSDFNTDSQLDFGDNKYELKEDVKNNSNNNNEEIISYENIIKNYTVDEKKESDDRDGLASQKDLDEIHKMEYCKPLKFNIYLAILYYILAVISLGILLIISRWFEYLRDVMTHLPSTFEEADLVLIKNAATKALTTCKIKTYDLDKIQQKIRGFANGNHFSVRVFTYRHVKYIYDVELKIFRKLQFNTSLPYDFIHKNFSNGLSENIHTVRRVLFGKNLIDVPMKNVVSLLLDEVLHPFYIFQIVSVIIWCMDEYFSYATCIVVSSTLSAIVSLVETRRNMIKLRDMAHYACEINRYYGNTVERVSSEMLVPGDIVELEDGLLLPCDVLLLSGQCILNESMLTGESIPVVKTGLPLEGKELYSPDKDKSHTLYSGTTIVQTRKFGGQKILGTVVKTGFDTAKGKLMLSILYPKPSTFKFYQDAFRFVGVMFVLGIAGIIYSIIKLALMGVPAFSIFLRAADVITITVPPALPVATSAGTAFALSRLRKRRIYCISPNRVNVGGKLELMCFDKTGTLTMEGLDLMGVKPMGQQYDFEEEILEAQIHDNLCDYQHLPEKKKLLLYAMASCHALTYVNFELVGDPLEVKIFEATRWKLKEPKTEDYLFESVIPTIVHPPHQDIKTELSQEEANDIDITEMPLELGILKKFEFKSSLQRMSVIAKNLKEDKTYCFVKGSPEMMMKLCLPESLPPNYSQILYEYAHQGLRVISVGVKVVNLPWNKLQKSTREEIECDLVFLGFICMQNKLKSDTKDVIRQLKTSGLRNVMVTGDNPYTAIAVSRQCGIVPKSCKIYLGELKENDKAATNQKNVDWKEVDEGARLNPESLLPEENDEAYQLAVTGDVFGKLLGDHKFKYEMTRSDKYVNLDNPSLFHRVLMNCHIFSRMSPEQKMQLVEEYQKLEYFVGMCGDGSNDSIALKAAHIGVSLSECEASIAAPFTSLKPTIACVPEVIKEGKASLATSFQMFKYMSVYSLIQFFTVILLYEINSNLGDNQFLAVDLFVILTTSILMGRTAANRFLVKEEPSGSLVSREVFISMGFQLLVTYIFQVIVWFNMKSQSWFVPLNPEPDTKDNIKCFETTAMFTMSTFHTLNCGLAFSISRPFKRPLHTNRIYFAALVILYILCGYAILYPDYYTREFLRLVTIPQYYRNFIFGLVLLHLVIVYAFERFFIVGYGLKWLKMISFRPIIKAIHRIIGSNKYFSNQKKLYGKLREAIETSNSQMYKQPLQMKEEDALSPTFLHESNSGSRGLIV
ncbi:hypothetical protein ABK040_000112 [Willaertia magna]